MNIINELNSINKRCSGCGACYSICPTEAITMNENPQGFLYPAVRKDKCIECRMCISVCPKINPDVSNTDQPKCYAARGNDTVRKDSSSGGIFTILAEWVIKHNGVVIGATMDQTFHVYHVAVEKAEDLYKIKKSKYVQSNTGKIYQKLKEYVSEGRMALFSGTPCQVAAAKNYIGNNRGNVFFVDVLCHGVPSEKMWLDYLHESFDLDAVETVEFRSKLNGWRAEQLRVFFTNGSSKRIEWHESMYEEGFQRNISLRDGCENCEFSGLRRQGDLSLGDFWRVEEYDSNLNDKKGTSVVLVNNAVGEGLLEQIKDDLIDLKETPIAAARFNRLKEKFPSHPMKERFKKLYPATKTFSDAIWQCRHSLYDIGLVGIYTVRNYGAHITYYALYSVLTEMGYSVLMIDCPKDSRLKTKDTPELFMHNPYPSWAQSRRFENLSEMKFLNLQCDTFVVGSDQMFNNLLYNDFHQFMTLNFVTDDKKKIAYAASCGHDHIWGPEGDRATEAYFLQKFDYFSVREDTGVKLFEREFGVKNAKHVLDPVFLMNMEKYKELIEKGKDSVPDQPYLFAYILDPSPAKEAVLRDFAKRKGLTIRALVDAFDSINGKKPNWSLDTLSGQKIESWIAHIALADYVITDSFHGTCLSIIFHKEFISVINEQRGVTRFTSLLKQLGLEGRAVYDLMNLKDSDRLDARIDYMQIDQLLDKLKTDSKQWLREAIENKDMKKPFSTFDILDSRIDELWKRTDIRSDSVQKGLSDIRQEVSLIRDELNQKNELLIQKEEELNREISLIRDELNQKNELLIQNEEELNRKEREMEDVYNSVSFRSGRAMTYFPRMIRRYFRKRKN